MADNTTIQPPEGYTPLTADQKSQWNGFASHMVKQNLGPELDGNPDLGHALMTQYSQRNPGFTITSAQIPHIQYEHQALRTGDNPLAALGKDSYYARKTSPTDGNINAVTASSFYPTFATRDKNGQVIKDYGTDAEKFLGENPGAIASGGKGGAAPAKAAAPASKKAPAAKEDQTPEPNVPIQGQPGTAPVNQTDKDALKWTQDYINSPKYKERLGNFYQHPDLVQGARAQKMGATTFTQTKGAGTNYSDDQYLANQVNVDPGQIKDTGATRAEAVVHELGHGTNANETSKALHLNPVEENYIISRNKNVDPKAVPGYLNDARQQGADSLSNYLKGHGETHDLAPSETMSDIQGLRYLLHREKIYDAGTQDLTPDVLKKASQNDNIKNSLMWKRLHENFDDKGIQDIMNNIAYQAPPATTNAVA